MPCGEINNIAKASHGRQWFLESRSATNNSPLKQQVEDVVQFLNSRLENYPMELKGVFLMDSTNSNKLSLSIVERFNEQVEKNLVKIFPVDYSSLNQNNKVSTTPCNHQPVTTVLTPQFVATASRSPAFPVDPNSHIYVSIAGVHQEKPLWSGILSSSTVKVSLSHNYYLDDSNQDTYLASGLSVSMMMNGAEGANVFLSGEVLDDSTRYNLVGMYLGRFYCDNNNSNKNELSLEEVKALLVRDDTYILYFVFYEHLFNLQCTSVILA